MFQNIWIYISPNLFPKVKSNALERESNTAILVLLSYLQVMDPPDNYQTTYDSKSNIVVFYSLIRYSGGRGGGACMLESGDFFLRHPGQHFFPSHFSVFLYFQGFFTQKVPGKITMNIAMMRAHTAGHDDTCHTIYI